MAPEIEVGCAAEPVAVIGASCRLPKAPNPERFWELLRTGDSAIIDSPKSRSDLDPDLSRMLRLSEFSDARRGGFVEDIDRFDAKFFGITPGEATAMDPQQRLMLELCWEALEDARVSPEDIKGSLFGVYVGAISNDYSMLLHRYGVTAISQYSFTGLHRSMIANRISYFWGLRGPSLVVDTGQSSSLVAMHMACQSLRNGESIAALVGGVHLNLALESLVGISRLGALSPEGECYTFDSRANGIVRGEGGVVLVVKLLSQAIADGDEIYSVLRGSAVNSGAAETGLTVPSQVAQEEVLRLACAQAHINPVDVQYVELHGTGTKLGDPIEAAALGAVFGEGRQAGSPLFVGSVKTNIGHLEGAAGLAGLLKVILSMKYAHLPASRNFKSANPLIPINRLGLCVQSTLDPWPRRTEPRLAGISSFGIGGINCHIILSDWLDCVDENDGSKLLGMSAGKRSSLMTRNMPWVVSGRGEGALRAQAGRLREFVESRPELDPVGVGWSLVTTR
ncbi:type I polyketide synthase, partial [Actinomadura chokoriensis]